jgi:AbrB family looped-hinge helix DNA binding protein
MNLVKLNQNGQVSIPANLRKRLSLKQGDLLRAEEDPSGKIILTPVSITEKRSVTKLDLKKYEADGVDIGLLISSLAKTPTERAETNKELLKFIEEAKKARKKLSNARS